MSDDLLRSLEFQSDYRTSRSDLLRDFYLPALGAAVKYDRSVGYFRGTLLAVTGIAFSDFAQRGGQMRLICSPSLDPQDAAAIARGSEMSNLDHRLSAEIDEVFGFPENRPFLELLATLVASGVLEIRIADNHGRGIFHDKVGIFVDTAGDTVSFEGSSNESWSAWMQGGNHEGFGVFLSWEEGREAGRVRLHSDYFESLWENQERFVEVMAFPDAAKAKLIEHSNPEGLDEAAEAVVRHLGLVRSPYGEEEPGRLPDILMDHQTAVLESWHRADMHGIVKHATGSGKTLVAIEAIRQWIGVGRPALVLVPSRYLQGQWLGEIRRFLNPDLLVLEVGGQSGKAEWRGHIGNWTDPAVSLGPRLVLATMASAAGSEFLSRARGGEHLLVVADEVHRIGSPRWRAVMGLDNGASMGLSATPERYGDPDGTQAILEYFGLPLEPEMSLADAIAVGRLVPYDYHITFARLSEEEQDQWDTLTRRIARAIARGGLPDWHDLTTLSDDLQILFINRSRILKKAASKVSRAVETIATTYAPGDSWLVYCEDRQQVREVLDAIRQRGLEADPYHSAMGGAEAIVLDQFIRKGGIVVAIRCLDEGVDIPAVDHAMILASSSNPRQFIQRRGRVLRKASNKHRATIHDLFVLPHASVTESDALPILRSELARARIFAEGAANLAGATDLDMVISDFAVADATGWHWEQDEQPDLEEASDG